MGIGMISPFINDPILLTDLTFVILVKYKLEISNNSNF